MILSLFSILNLLLLFVNVALICFFSGLLILKHLIEDEYYVEDIGTGTTNLTSNHTKPDVKTQDIKKHDAKDHVVKIPIRVTKYYDLFVVFGVTMITLVVLEQITISIIVMLFGLILSFAK